MKRNDTFSCVIIGAGSLPIRCAEILLEGGHQIRAVVSSDAEVMRWARQKELAHLSPTANLSEQLSGGEPFDYLFSIVNEHILREDVLSLPRRLAVNYHDAPLPRYAGTHATSWALMNGEQTHGISWHEITDVVDAGDILKQRLVIVAPDDTALTLNTKCFEAAINAFAELVEELAAGSATLTKQNLDERTFFARFKRPAQGCVISFKSRAAEISALVRALDFGMHPNPLGAAKVLVGDKFFIISEVEMLDSVSPTLPGTINEVGSDFLRVSAADKEIVLRSLQTLDGQAISIFDLAKRFDLQKGYQFRELDGEMAQRLDAVYKSVAKHELFWVKRLLTLESIALPYGKNTVIGESDYASVVMKTPVQVVSFLEERKQELKSDHFFLAAFGALLARLGGLDGFDVGYQDAQIQDEIGGLESFFAPSLPLRIDVDHLKNFTELLIEITGQVETVRNRRIYALDLVTRHSQLRAASESGSRFTLPVVIAMVKQFEGYQPLPDSELTLLIAENEAECRWVYNRAKIQDESVEKLINHFTILMKGIVADAEQAIAYLPILSEEEQQQLLIELNATQADYPKETCIHQMVAARAREFPKALAVSCGDEHLSYAELDNRSNQLARRLRQMGVGPEVLVAVCLERSIQTVVGLLAILKAGGAYVPLDPAYPQERLAFMLEDAEVRVLLTQQKLQPLFSEHKHTILCLDSDWDTLADESAEIFESSAAANNLAYVIYTSGSTGKPKGVELEHRGLVNLVTWHQRIYNLTPADRATLLAGPAFDASVWELWTYLAAGASVHIPDEETRASAPKLLVWLAQHKITVCFLPTPLAEAVLEQPMPPGLVLRALLTGGDRLHRVAQESLPFKLFNHYGPTENTVVATYGEVKIGTETETAPTIGRPIANVRVYLLDRYLQPVPVGLPGEMFIGGDSLARGYLNRPDLTAERFIAHSFDNRHNLNLYKTGDLVRYLPNGDIDFLDRIDSQVKIRGFRIELGEIETMLLSHAAIEECVVLAREDQPGNKRLAAYVVQKQGQSVKTNELRSFLKEKLPDYMVPSAFVELERLPLTPNGKVDRKALPAPAANVSDSERDFVAHRDALELELTKIWETILGVQPIGVSDDFFELGGHSLQAVRMFAEVEKTFNKNIPLATLFQAGTIEKLADILRQEGWAERESSLVAIQPKGDKPPFFCVHAKGGNVLFYRDLARYLGEDQPFYGIQARRLGGRQVGHGSVEEMAEFYIKEIQTLQPVGPYYLGGSSFGGLAAFEIARQLDAQGERVAMVALLDTGTPNYPKLLPTTTVFSSKFYHFVRRVQHQRDSLRLLNFQEKVKYLKGKLANVRKKYRRKINNNYKKAVRKFYTEFKGKGSIPASYIQIEDQIWRAGQKYVPEVYSGKVTLFRASNQPLGIHPDPTLGWEGLAAGGLEIHEVPGHHGSIVAEPFVRVLAEQLRNLLEKAQSEEQITGKVPPIESDKREFVGSQVV